MISRSDITRAAFVPGYCAEMKGGDDSRHLIKQHSRRYFPSPGGDSGSHRDTRASAQKFLYPGGFLWSVLPPRKAGQSRGFPSPSPRRKSGPGQGF